MSDLLLIAVRVAGNPDEPEDRIGLAVRTLLDAVGDRAGPPAHVTAYEEDELTPELVGHLAQAFGKGRPKAFRTADLP